MRITTKQYFLTTFGCQMNQADGQRIRGILLQAGYSETTQEKDADLILFNTCCVREHAEERLISRVRALQPLKVKKPGLLIAVGGCFAQKEKQHMATILPIVDLAFGPNDLPRLIDLIEEAEQRHRVFGNFTEEGSFIGEEADGIILERPFSAFVNIIRGCTNFCTYCIVPSVRGPEVSRPADELVRLVSDLTAKGVVEITLLGQNVNAYGKDLGMEDGFVSLLERLNDLPMKRIRFLTSHPRDFHLPDIERISRLDRLCEQFHLPVQAGSNRILQMMNRGYSREDYLKLISTLRRHIPGVCFTTDIICGFPSETDDEFEETIDLIKIVRFEAAYTYYFSPRQGTSAASLPDQLPLQVRKTRLAKLIELQNHIALEESQKCLGSLQEVLVESKATRVAGHLYGKTRTGRIVDFKGNDHLIGKLVQVRIEKARNWTLSGDLQAD